MGLANSNIYAKLARIQMTLHAPKDKKNNFGGFQYRNVEGIIDLLKPILAKENCCILLFDDVREIGGRFYIEATAKMVDTESGESLQTSALAREEDHRAKMDDAQLTGACSSYARKYALCGLFAISAGADFDAMNNADNDELRAITDAVAKAKTKNELAALWAKIPEEHQKELQPYFTAAKKRLESN